MAAIDKAQGFFDKITEENIDLAHLRGSADPDVAAIGTAMTAYRALLVQNARVVGTWQIWAPDGRGKRARQMNAADARGTRERMGAARESRRV